MMNEFEARYKGNGEFLQGIPARDLTAAEWDGLTDEQRQLAEASGLYLIESALRQAQRPAPRQARGTAPRQARGTEKDGE